MINEIQWRKKIGENYLLLAFKFLITATSGPIHNKKNEDIFVVLSQET